MACTGFKFSLLIKQINVADVGADTAIQFGWGTFIFFPTNINIKKNICIIINHNPKALFVLRWVIKRQGICVGITLRKYFQNL